MDEDVIALFAADEPKPLSALKNFTVPVLNVFFLRIGCIRVITRIRHLTRSLISPAPWSHSNAPLPRAKRCQPSHAQTMTTRGGADAKTIRLISAGSVTATVDGR
jgi:hypothetical protein